MSEKTLLKKIEQAFKENYCNGTYKVELENDYAECTYYGLYYTYKTGETIAVDIEVTFLGEVKFYSPVHSYYISNFSNHIKSVINVLRMLFDLIDSNKEDMIKYYEIKTEEPEEPEETTEITETEETNETEKHYYDYTAEDFIKAGIAKECTDCPDFCEEDCIENAECARGNDVFDGCKKSQYFDTDTVQPNKTIIAKIEDINYCPNQNTCCAVSPYVHCDYNYKSDACIKAHKNFIHYCEQVHKHLKAINNPEWHNVSLAKLADIDFDMLDEKRQLYLSLYREIKELLKDLHNCKLGRSYEKRLAKMHSRNADLVYENKVTSDYIRYVTRKVSMCNVECGLWPSANEVSTGYHKSRRYTQLTIRY